MAFTGQCSALDQAPTMPHVFYGVVFVEDQTAPAGASVEGRGTGVQVPLKGNPILTGSGGTYGGQGSYAPKLIVQGTINEGTSIEFYVNGERAEVFDVATGSGWTSTYPFHSTGVTELNLRIATLPGTTVTTTQTTIPTTTTSATPTATYTYSGSSSGGGGGGGGGTSYSFPSSASAKTSTVTATPTARSTGMENPTRPVITEMQTQETAPPALEQVPQENEPVSTGKPGQPWTIFGIPGMWVVGLIGAIVIVNVSVIGILKLRQGRE